MNASELCKPQPKLRPDQDLLLAEGHAVGALILSGIALVGAHTDLAQSAVVAALGVVGALIDGTFDALVLVHTKNLLCFGFGDSITGIRRDYSSWPRLQSMENYAIMPLEKTVIL